jgi:hypothetical protein
MQLFPSLPHLVGLIEGVGWRWALALLVALAATIVRIGAL